MSPRRPASSRGAKMILAVVAASIGVLATLVAVPVGALGGAPPAEALVKIGSAHGASFVPALRRDRPLFILVLGSDARPGQAVDRARADSIHLIGIDRAGRRATIVGFPRDSYVPIAGGGRGKINEAMVVGGPRGVVATVEALTGIRIDFWLLTSFVGLERMVNEVGGINVDVPYPMNDPYSGANFSAGRQRLSGGEALAFARNRYDTPRGDFSRSENHGRLIIAALDELRRSFRDDPATLFRFMRAFWRHVDTDLSPATLLDLAIAATRVQPRRVRNLVVPGSAGSAGGASVVYISGGSLFADMRGDGVVG